MERIFIEKSRIRDEKDRNKSKITLKQEIAERGTNIKLLGHSRPKTPTSTGGLGFFIFLIFLFFVAYLYFTFFHFN